MSDTNPVPAPMAADLSRVLAADLGAYQAAIGYQRLWWLRENADEVIPAAIRRAIAAEAECERLRKLIERDRTGLAAGLSQVLRECRSWRWLGNPDEWSCYEWDEQTCNNMRREMQWCLDAIEKAAEAALRASGDRVTEAFRRPGEGNTNG